MDIKTIKTAVTASQGVRVGRLARLGQKRVVDPYDQLAQEQRRRELERTCGQIERDVADLQQEQSRAAALNGQLKQRIENLSDGFFGAESMFNRSELRDLRDQQEQAQRLATELGQMIANKLGQLLTCREELGQFI